MECLGSGKGKRRHINSRIKLKTRPIGRFGGIDIYIWLLSYQFCMNLKLQEENSTMKYAKLVKIKVRETQTSVRPLAFIWQKVLLSKSLFQLSSHPLCSYVMEGTPLQGSPVAKPPNCAFLSHLLYISNLWRSYRIWELLKWYFLLALNIDRFFVISLHSNLTFLVPSEDICHQISSSSLRDCKSFL